MQETLTGFQVSPQQKQLWSLGQESPAFRSRVFVLIEGSLDGQALREAVTKVILRHEVLRTTYQRRSGMKVPLQVVNEALEPSWRSVDMSTLTDQAQEEKLADLFREEGRRTIDLEHGPVLHLSLVMLGRDRHVLLVTAPVFTAASMISWSMPPSSSVHCW